MNDTAAGGIMYGQPQTLPIHAVRLAGRPVRLMLARTDEQRAYGLMFRTEMAADEGMLFCYSIPQPMVYWMKNTILPLDLILFGDDLRISEVIRGMKPGIGIPDAQLPRYAAAGLGLYALEMASGTADAWDLRPGDQLEIPLPLLNAD